MTPQFQISRQNIFVVAFFVLLVFLLSLLFTILEPFLRAFVWATILVMVFYPVFSFLLRRTKNRDLSALLATLFVLGILALPGFFVAINLGPELRWAYTFLSSTHWDEKSQWLLAELKSWNFGPLLNALGLDNPQSEAGLLKEMTNVMQDLSTMVIDKVLFLIHNLAGFLLEIIFTTVALFFFFRDGSRLAFKAIEFLPMESEYRDKMVHVFSVTVTAVVRAIFLSSLLQGFLAGVGFVVVGLPLPVLFGLVAFINAFIPFLGAASVWIPSCVWLLVQGQTGPFWALLIWGIILTVIDQFLRPWLIGNEAKISAFWLFFTTIGGLKVYGLLGVFLGPIILALGLAFLAIYREVYLPQEKPVRVRKAFRR
jgi:predicted PurR-regulated permease PerM